VEASAALQRVAAKRGRLEDWECRDQALVGVGVPAVPHCLFVAPLGLLGLFEAVPQPLPRRGLFEAVPQPLPQRGLAEVVL